jgi:uncharacterized OsmC-like protein
VKGKSPSHTLSETAVDLKSDEWHKLRVESVGDRMAARLDGVELKAERAESDPKIFTRIHMHFTVRGKGIPPEVVERAIKMSHDKYCSASIMLGKTAEITTGFEVIEV